MRIARKDTFLITAFFFGLTIAVFLFDLKTSSTICCPCLLSPQAEWTLYQPRPEILAARLYSACPPRVENVTVMQFERSDFVAFSPDLPVSAGLHLRRGERIGTIESTDNLIRLQELGGSLEVARADLASISTGSKRPLTLKAVRELDYAREQLAANDKIRQRKQEMFNRDLISREEMELAESENKLLALNVAVAEQSLDDVRSGEKQEAVLVAEQRISAIETEMTGVRGKLADMVIRVPFSGVVLEPDGDTTLFRLGKLDTVVARIPVSEDRRQQLEPGCTVLFSIPAASVYDFEARIESIDRTPCVINGKTRYLARCLIPNRGFTLLAGMTGTARIACRKAGLGCRCASWLNDLKQSFQLYQI